MSTIASCSRAAPSRTALHFRTACRPVRSFVLLSTYLTLSRRTGEGTKATLSDLTPATTYEILILAGRDEEPEQLGARLSATTADEPNTAATPGALISFTLPNLLTRVHRESEHNVDRDHCGCRCWCHFHCCRHRCDCSFCARQAAQAGQGALWQHACSGTHSLTNSADLLTHA